MTTLRCIILLQFATVLCLGQVEHSELSNSRKQSEAPKAVVRSLYREVVARHPMGIPQGKEWTRITPYLSKRLIVRLNETRACEKDYFKQYPDPNSKPPFDWMERGLFSGSWEKAAPGGFRFDKTELENDGSFRLHLSLRYRYPPPPEWWHIVVIVVEEDGRFVVDDVISFPEDVKDVETHLSELLTHGCDGSKWVGHRDQRADSAK
jgi:hypothetical protein